ISFLGMRILYLGINYWPDESGIAPFATGRCEYLAECGHEVVACTGLPYYPQWRVAAAYRRRLLVREERAGVSIQRSWMYVPRKLTSLRRMVQKVLCLLVVHACALWSAARLAVGGLASARTRGQRYCARQIMARALCAACNRSAARRRRRPRHACARTTRSRVLSTRGGGLPACRDGLDSHRSDARPHHREARAA